MPNLMLHDQPLETLIYLRDSMIKSYNDGTMHPYPAKFYDQSLAAYNQAIAIKQQHPDMLPIDRATIADTLNTKDSNLVDCETVIKFIDRDPSSQLSMDLFSIKFPESYHSWLCSDLNAKQYFEQYYS